MNVNINISVGGDWSEQPLQGLAALREASKQIDAQVWSAVKQAKLAGHTWEQIGASMGLSKQAVFERYAQPVRVTEQAFNDFVSHTAIGATVRGRVVSTVPFGVFVSVEPGVEGLLPASRTTRPLTDFVVDEEIDVRLESFDLDRRRVAFSSPPL
jgi:polyribonucleotide nucleotidyltransferase